MVRFDIALSGLALCLAVVAGLAAWAEPAEANYRLF